MWNDIKSQGKKLYNAVSEAYDSVSEAAKDFAEKNSADNFQRDKRRHEAIARHVANPGEQEEYASPYIEQSREFHEEVGRASGKEAKELTQTAVDLAAPAAATKGIGIIGSIKRGIKNSKTLITIEDKTGKAITKIKNFFKEEHVIQEEAAVIEKGLEQGAKVVSKDSSMILSGSKTNHINGAIGELRGYRSAIEDLNHVGIKPPGKVTARGADYITFNPSGEGTIVVWDAKYRGPGGTYPKQLSDNKLKNWMPEVRKAISDLPPSALKDAAIDALQNGRIEGQIFRWPR